MIQQFYFWIVLKGNEDPPTQKDIQQWHLRNKGYVPRPTMDAQNPGQNQILHMCIQLTLEQGKATGGLGCRESSRLKLEGINSPSVQSLQQISVNNLQILPSTFLSLTLWTSTDWIFNSAVHVLEMTCIPLDNFDAYASHTQGFPFPLFPSLFK